MKKKLIINYISTAILFIIFIAFTFIVYELDLHIIGPARVVVGLSSVNEAVFNAFQYNLIWHKLTQYLGIVPIIIALGFAVLGIVQLLKTKTINGVDYKIWFLAAFYIILFLFYLLFERMVINYRPILINKMHEASYPSSHTMLALCIMTTAMIFTHRFFKQKKYIVATDLVSIIIMTVIVIGRLLSGMHWFTDIIGGIIISSALIMLYYSAITTYEYRKKITV